MQFLACSRQELHDRQDLAWLRDRAIARPRPFAEELFEAADGLRAESVALVDGRFSRDKWRSYG